MLTTHHAQRRMDERGIGKDLAIFMQMVLPSKYSNQSNQYFLTRKQAIFWAKKLRDLANKIEKGNGTCLIFDRSGEHLITAYKRNN